VSAFYARLQQVALRLIGQYGLPLTFTERTIIYDAVQDKKTASNDTLITARGVLLDVGVSVIDGSRIESGRRVILLDTAKQPRMGWKLDADANGSIDAVGLFPGAVAGGSLSGVWTVVEIKTIAPGGVPLLYEVQVSK
jgi:hypothetical protein